jgi:phenylacetate-CoA ligase
LAELVLTTLDRRGCPVIRYRTGDLVRPTRNAAEGNRFVFLEGGVLGRADDMLVIRGMNIFPSSVEQILRGFADVAEYRLIADKAAEMDVLTVEVEDRLNQPERIARELHLRLGLNVEVQSVPLGSLPRFEGKARRFVDRRPR